MKKKVVVISDKVAFYMRFSTEEKADAFKDKYLILHESEAKDLFKQEILWNQLSIESVHGLWREYR